MLKIVLMAMLLLINPAVALADDGADDINVSVKKDGELFSIDLDFTIAATPAETWAVLTDYDHMPQFLPYLQSSKIAEKNGDLWKVEQKGRSVHGIFSFEFETVREVKVQPLVSLRSHLIGGGTMKKLDSLTQLSSSGSGTHVVYHSESILNVWVPPLIGTSMMEDEIRKQFQYMKKEILTRKIGVDNAR